jgi:hypothetical protein
MAMAAAKQGQRREPEVFQEPRRYAARPDHCSGAVSHCQILRDHAALTSALARAQGVRSHSTPRIARSKTSANSTHATIPTPISRKER